MNTIPDHVGREAVRLLNEPRNRDLWAWPNNKYHDAVVTVAKLLMNPPAPMTDPDEEAAKRVLRRTFDNPDYFMDREHLTRATEQMRKEREMWEAGR